MASLKCVNITLGQKWIRKMPRKILPLHEREGLKGIDPDESLEAMLELTSETPAEDIAGLFFNDRAKFFILHRWVGTNVFEETLGQEEKDRTLLQTLRYELSEALLQLANNQNSEFLMVHKKTGPRGTTHLLHNQNRQLDENHNPISGQAHIRYPTSAQALAP